MSMNSIYASYSSLLFCIYLGMPAPFGIQPLTTKPYEDFRGLNQQTKLSNLPYTVLIITHISLPNWSIIDEIELELFLKLFWTIFLTSVVPFTIHSWIHSVQFRSMWTFLVVLFDNVMLYMFKLKHVQLKVLLEWCYWLDIYELSFKPLNLTNRCVEDKSLFLWGYGLSILFMNNCVTW